MRWRCRCPTVAAGFQTREVRRNENDQGQRRRWRRLTKLVKNRNIETLTNNDDNDCWRWWLKHFVVRLREKTRSPNYSAGRTSFCVFLSHMAYVVNDSTINMVFCISLLQFVQYYHRFVMKPLNITAWKTFMFSAYSFFTSSCMTISHNLFSVVLCTQQCNYFYSHVWICCIRILSSVWHHTTTLTEIILNGILAHKKPIQCHSNVTKRLESIYMYKKKQNMITK